jgi:acetoin utilization deacetylase AcuC-like enzyme
MLPIAFHPIYKHPLPENHRFPMLKYELLPKQLLHEGTAETTDFFEPEQADINDVLSVHDPVYVFELQSLSLPHKAVRKIGFPLSAALVEREFRIAQGTITAAQLAQKHGVAFNIAGGTHHAYTNQGEAFCMLNDQAIAAQFLLNNNLSKKILIVDLDVHQGNGTAQIFANNPNVFTFSMHGKNNYPFKKETSSLDIALADGTNDDAFLTILNDVLPKLIKTEKPDFLFYLAGVDVLQTDKLGKLALTLGGCKTRDEIVFKAAKQYEIPIQVSMGGGYSPEIKTIIEAHSNTYRAARAIF